MFAYSLDVEVDTEAPADTTDFPGAVAWVETHRRQRQPTPNHE